MPNSAIITTANQKQEKRIWRRYLGGLITPDHKISRGIWEVYLSRNHCWRNIRSCRRLLSEIKYGRDQHRMMRMTAALSEDNPIGLYCKKCEDMIWLGEVCIKKKLGRGRSTYYHKDCAEIVHLI